jgi:hypothetical protein
MTVNDPMVGFVAMALAITAILTVGTLIAADIIHVGSRDPRLVTREPETSKPTHDPVATLAPLGSSLAAGSTLRADTGSTRRERLPSATP